LTYWRLKSRHPLTNAQLGTLLANLPDLDDAEQYIVLSRTRLCKDPEFAPWFLAARPSIPRSNRFLYMYAHSAIRLTAVLRSSGPVLSAQGEVTAETMATLALQVLAERIERGPLDITAGLWSGFDRELTYLLRLSPGALEAETAAGAVGSIRRSVSQVLDAATSRTEPYNGGSTVFAFARRLGGEDVCEALLSCLRGWDAVVAKIDLARRLGADSSQSSSRAAIRDAFWTVIASGSPQQRVSLMSWIASRRWDENSREDRSLAIEFAQESLARGRPPDDLARRLGAMKEHMNAIYLSERER
jgi:hypothetical protein